MAGCLISSSTLLASLSKTSEMKMRYIKKKKLFLLHFTSIYYHLECRTRLDLSALQYSRQSSQQMHIFGSFTLLVTKKKRRHNKIDYIRKFNYNCSLNLISKFHEKEHHVFSHHNCTQSSKKYSIICCVCS